ncbi:hypothetical protein QTP70_003932 [Hemibagrus guttatus]|uniref:CCR4-NOT transcription complex subunit 4 n=1 Tax=Hemibagrus guttatus TaxID=175788 RepID=A0AAE0QXC1_9TELE|nr:hypothetical protein QTP70_003932 [Hemibagrus guttatus]
MSRSPELKEDPMECPLCMEPLEIDDVNFFPCTCGYQICRFCWHRIRTDENGLCPACRKVEAQSSMSNPCTYLISINAPYPEDPAVYKPLSQEEIQRIKNEKKQKQNEKKQKVTENRKHLASVRVVQRNLVFVVGLSQRLADPEVLKRPEYFGKFGKIHKVVINNSTSYAGSQGPSASAYVTYIRSEDALRAIQCVNNVIVDGRTLKAGKHQEYEQKLLQDLYKANPNFLQTSSCGGEKSKNKANATQSPVDKPTEPVSIGNGENIAQVPSSDSPSPPPGFSKPSLAVPISVAELTARSPFEGAPAESQSLFSDNSNFRHPNPIPSSLPSFPSSPQSGSDWPMTPEPQSLFTSDTIPVSSSTDWQAAFGFGSSAKQQQQEDDLGFDPFDVTRKALADLIEKELSVQEASPRSPSLLPNGQPRLPPLQHRGLYNSFSLPAHAHASPAHQPWMGLPTRNNLAHLNHITHSHFLDPSCPPQHHSTGLGGITISAENRSSVESINVKEWQDGLRALLPNININFGGIPNSTSSSSSSSSSSTSSMNHMGIPAGPVGLSHSLSWDGTTSWMDPAIITGLPASTGNSLDYVQDENPPHWLKSLQALTEIDGPSGSVVSQPRHSGMMDSAVRLPLHRGSWAPYLPPPSLAPSHFHSPPPGFQTAFRPPAQTTTDLLQSAAMERH